jgi:glutathione peroxidase
MPLVYDFNARALSGTETSLRAFEGKVLLIVNTASECGFTPQYRGLQQLHRDYEARGLAVLAFPCNQFGRQEPGEAEQIAEFCETNYAVTFPLFEKIEVNGVDAHPLFRWLKSEAPGLLGTERIKWNFTKFLIGRDGRVVRRFAPNTQPEELRDEIERLL